VFGTVGEPRGSKRVGEIRHTKLNINLKNCTFSWFVLSNCITIHGASNVKF
jgi:hypothetical protein